MLGENMKKAIFLFTGIICLCSTFVGCGNNHDMTVTDNELPIQNSISSTEESSFLDNAPVTESENPTENSNIVNAEELEDTFGILISLPENANWIADSKYYLVDENNLKITYHDFIADADCTLLAAKNENLNLPQNEYDETLDESWEGRTTSNQNIMVKVQHGKDNENTVLATWEYNEYRFAIMGEVKDIYSFDFIPKVALYIINNLD